MSFFRSNFFLNLFKTATPNAMKRIKTLLFISAVVVLASCGSSSKKTNDETVVSGSEETQGKIVIEEDISLKGNVAFVDLKDSLEEALVEEGKLVFNNRCYTCHNLSEEKLVGPGWAGITNRRDPKWIMNMILNVNIMKEFDSLAHAVSKENVADMPNQYLSVGKARSVLEFMRQNDLDQLGSKDEGVKNDPDQNG